MGLSYGFFEQVKMFYKNKRYINLVLDGTGYNRSQVVKDEGNSWVWLFTISHLTVLTRI
jgi:hypothetical protein